MRTDYQESPMSEFRAIEKDGKTVYQQKYLFNYWVSISPPWVVWKDIEVKTVGDSKKPTSTVREEI